MTRSQTLKTNLFLAGIMYLTGLFVWGLLKWQGMGAPSSGSSFLIIMGIYAVSLLLSWSFGAYVLLSSMTINRVRSWIRQYRKSIGLIYASVMGTAMMILFLATMWTVTDARIFMELGTIFAIDAFVQVVLFYTIVFNLVKLRILHAVR